MLARASSVAVAVDSFEKIDAMMAVAVDSFDKRDAMNNEDTQIFQPDTIDWIY